MATRLGMSPGVCMATIAFIFLTMINVIETRTVLRIDPVRNKFKSNFDEMVKNQNPKLSWSIEDTHKYNILEGMKQRNKQPPLYFKRVNVNLLTKKNNKFEQPTPYRIFDELIADVTNSSNNQFYTEAIKHLISTFTLTSNENRKVRRKYPLKMLTKHFDFPDWKKFETYTSAQGQTNHPVLKITTDSKKKKNRRHRGNIITEKERAFHKYEEDLERLRRILKVIERERNILIQMTKVPDEQPSHQSPGEPVYQTIPIKYHPGIYRVENEPRHSTIVSHGSNRNMVSSFIAARPVSGQFDIDSVHGAADKHLHHLEDALLDDSKLEIVNIKKEMLRREMEEKEKEWTFKRALRELIQRSYDLRIKLLRAELYKKKDNKRS